MNVIFVQRLAVFVSIAAADSAPQPSAAAGVDASGHILIDSSHSLPGPGLSRGPGRPGHENEAESEQELASRGALMVRREDPSAERESLTGWEEEPAWWSRLPFLRLLRSGQTHAAAEGLRERRADCRWGSWGSWQGCSSSCGGGRKARRRDMHAAAEGGGAPCPGESREELPCGEDPCPVDEARGAVMTETRAVEALPKEAYALQGPSEPCKGKMVQVMTAGECQEATKALGLFYDNDVSWDDYISGCFALQNINFVKGSPLPTPKEREWWQHGTSNQQLSTEQARYDVYFNRAGGTTSQYGQAICKNAKARGRDSRTVTYYRESRRGASCPKGMRHVDGEEDCEAAAYLLGKAWNNGSVGSWQDSVTGCFEGDEHGIPSGTLHFNNGGWSNGPKGFVICEEVVSDYSVQGAAAEACAKGSEQVRSVEECRAAASVLSKKWTNSSVRIFKGRISGCFEGEGTGKGDGVLYFNQDNASKGLHGLAVCKQAKESALRGQSLAAVRDGELAGKAPPSAGAPTAAPMPAALEAGCFVPGVRYHPDIRDQLETNEGSAMDCQRRCGLVKGCAHFGYGEKGACRLQDLSARSKNDSSVVSGPRKCPEACVQSGVAWLRKGDVNMPNQSQTIEMSANDCQRRCATVAGCAHFTYWPDGGCSLQDENAIAKTVQLDVLHGPSSCGPMGKGDLEALRKMEVKEALRQVQDIRKHIHDAEINDQKNNAWRQEADKEASEAKSKDGALLDQGLEEACEPGDYLNPSESKRRYSSVWAADLRGTGRARSKLGSKQAWSAMRDLEGQWLEMDLGKAMMISGTAVQGSRKDDEWVTKYKVKWSLDRRHWESQPEEAAGSSDRSTIVRNTFGKAVTARWVRLLAQSWHNRISMRAGVILCQAAPKKAIVVLHRAVSAYAEAAPKKAAATLHRAVSAYTEAAPKKAAATLHRAVSAYSEAAPKKAAATPHRTVSVHLEAAPKKAPATPHRAVSVHLEAAPKKAAATPHRTVSAHLEAAPKKAAATPHRTVSVHLEAASKKAAATPHRTVSVHLEATHRKTATASHRAATARAKVRQLLSRATGQKAATTRRQAASARREVRQLLSHTAGQKAATARRQAASVRHEVRQLLSRTTGQKAVTAHRRVASARREVRQLLSRTTGQKAVTAHRRAASAHREAKQVVAVPTQPPVCPPGDDFNPPEASRQYSSVHGDCHGSRAGCSSALDSSKAWTAQQNNVGQWIEIKLGKVQRIRGIILQGSGSSAAWVTKYRVTHSSDGKTWEHIHGTFKGCEDETSKVTNQFDWPVDASFVRVEVAAWHRAVSMRVGVLTCEVAAAPTPAPDSTLDKNDLQACHRGDDLNPSEFMRDYSSIWGGDPLGSNHARSMLDSDQAWSAGKNSPGQWLEIKLPGVKRLWGTVVQGRSNLPQWITKYKVMHTEDGHNWTTENETFTGGHDEATKIRNQFRHPVYAVSVRLVVLDWKGHLSTRAGLVACEEVGLPLARDAERMARRARAAVPQAAVETTTTTRLLIMPLPADETWLPQAARQGLLPVPVAPSPSPGPVALLPIDCMWSGWSTWRECTETCGHEGRHRRERYVRVYPQNGGRPCEGLRMEDLPCNRVPCFAGGWEEPVSVKHSTGQISHQAKEEPRHRPAHLSHHQAHSSHAHESTQWRPLHENHRHTHNSHAQEWVHWRPHGLVATTTLGRHTTFPEEERPGTSKGIHLRFTTRDPSDPLKWPVHPKPAWAASLPLQQSWAQPTTTGPPP